MKIVAMVLLAGLFGSGLYAQGNALDAAKAEYGRRREALQAARDEAVGKALALYRKELGNLLANVRPQGNLDYVLAIEAELKRLDAGGGAPLEPAAKDFSHLRRIQWAARQAEDKADKELAAQTAKLRTAYTAELERLEKTLVASNRIDEAKQAREEREGTVGDEAIEIVSGPPCEIVEYQAGEKVYPDMRRLWGPVPQELAGYQIARCALKSGGKWVVRPTSGDSVYALVPEVMASHFQDWQLVRRVDAQFGAEYHFVWLVMRKEATGSVAFPDGLTEAAFPFCRRITCR
jgi:hypothetical protein